MRWGPLRYGDAHAQRDREPHLGISRRRTTAGGILARSGCRRAGGAPGLRFHRGGLLGPRMGIATAGIRFLLRQTALRPPAWRSRERPAASLRLPGVSGKARAIR